MSVNTDGASQVLIEELQATITELKAEVERYKPTQKPEGIPQPDLQQRITKLKAEVDTWKTSYHQQGEQVLTMQATITKQANRIDEIANNYEDQLAALKENDL